MRSTQANRAQSGFTLIELVVVIAVLGLLAATALPRFVDMTTDARIAKMRAAQASLQTGASLFHAQWLSSGSPASTSAADSDSANSPVLMTGKRIAFFKGYPDVGGDGAGDALNGAADMPNSGILIAAGGLEDYVVAVDPPSLDKAKITIIPDSTHPNCKITYAEPVAPGDKPVIDDVEINATNGPANCR